MIGRVVVAALLASTASVALAGEAVRYEAAPAWVKPVAIGAADLKSTMPLEMLLSDQQVQVRQGIVSTYTEIAMRIAQSQGLSAGNISLPWQPDRDTLTIHKLDILRDGKTIALLKQGQTFTVMRREKNLESAVIDGVLTANVQPEGLQVGDVLDLAFTIDSHEPVMAGNAEIDGGQWNALPIARAHFQASWPAGMRMRIAQSQGLPTMKPTTAAGVTTIEMSMEKVAPLIAPKLAPPRYRIGRYAEVSSFASWADVAALMAPLYAKAAVIPASGPLTDEVARIRAQSNDPVVRAQAALVLVQTRIRYVAMAMGSGGLIPADAETTWNRRFGDCKAKTALLVAILHALDIPADPVAVNSSMGDGLDTRLPRVGAFDHVLVRTNLAGKTYWLDGTRIGDRSLDRLSVAPFGWGLPIVAKGGALVRVLPDPLVQPTVETTIQIDARGGLMIPAPADVSIRYRGDDALGMKEALSNLAPAARDQGMRDFWKKQYDFIDVTSTAADEDQATGDYVLSMKGKARMDWSSGWYETDGTSVGYRADFSRPVGQGHDAPYAVNFPYFTQSTEIIRLPPGFPDIKPDGKNDIDVTAGGIRYQRKVSLADGVFTAQQRERSVVPEFPAAEAPAAEAKLRELAEQTLYIRRPDNYVPSDAELTLWQQKTLTSDSALVERGYTLLNRGRSADAIKDLDAALAINPRNATALANRAMARLALQDLRGSEKDLSEAEQIEPRNAVASRGRGMLAESRGEWAAARKAYTSSLELDPDNLFSLYHRADVTRRSGDLVAALVDVDRVIKREPTAPEAYLLKANILRAMGNHDGVRDTARVLSVAAPRNAYAQVVAGRLYDSEGDRAAALASFDRALAIGPAAYIYLNRADVRPDDDVAGKIADLDKAAALDPKDIGVPARKAELLARQKRFPEAIAVYDALIATHPDQTGIVMSRGMVKMKAGQADAGRKDITAGFPASLSAIERNNRCWSLATEGMALDTALAECSKAAAAEPQTPAILDSRAFILLRLGRLDEAIADYDKALASSMQPTSLYGRGVAYMRRGDKTKGEADMAAAAKADPTIAASFAKWGVTP